MPKVVALEDVAALQYRQKGYATNIPFLKSSAQTPDSPVAFLSHGDLKRYTRPHWHVVDQFQVIVGGHGRLGRHEVAPYCVHFARAHTPYGPLHDDGEAAISFFTLRARFDPGPNYIPESRDKLHQIRDRDPWQISRLAEFAPGAASITAGGVDLRPIPGMQDERGLFAYALTMAACAETAAPDPSGGDGQCLLIVGGSLWHQSKECRPYTVVFIEPHEAAFQLCAGSDGVQALVLNFPSNGPRAAAAPAPVTTSGFRKWQCEFCSFAYDEAAGLPEEGIPAGTRWEDVPDSWTCPDCATSKSDFRMIEVARDR